MIFEEWQTIDRRLAEREHEYVWYGRKQGKTAAMILSLRANRGAKCLVWTEQQRDYLIARDVLPGQIVLMELPR